MDMPIKEDLMDLNMVESEEYREWYSLLSKACEIQKILKEHPNRRGLIQARSTAYNVLADIQLMLDSLNKNQV